MKNGKEKFSVNKHKIEEKSAEDLFSIAIELESKKDKNYKETEDAYDAAKEKFLEYVSKGDLRAKFAFRCIANKYRNKVIKEKERGTNKTIGSDDILEEPFKNIREGMLKEIKETEDYIYKDDDVVINFLKNIFNPENKGDTNTNLWKRLYSILRKLIKGPDLTTLVIRHSTIIYITAILKEMELFFYREGYEEEADEIYKRYMRHKVYSLRYRRKNPKSESFCRLIDKTTFFIRNIFLNIYWLFANFGVGVCRMIIWTLLIATVFSFCFYFTGTVKFNNLSDVLILNANSPIGPVNGTIKILDSTRVPTWLGCFYFSFSTLINLGSEIYIPYGFWGKFFELSESILGYILFGMVIALITRKLK